MRWCLVFVEREARTRFADGLDLDDAIASSDLGRYAEFAERGRLAGTSPMSTSRSTRSGSGRRG